jgi:RNA polymerase sigma factor (sigma-70 family)
LKDLEFDHPAKGIRAHDILPPRFEDDPIGRDARAAAVAGTTGGSGGSPAAVEPRAGHTTDPAARVEATELREADRQALVALPGRERTAVVSRVLDGRGYAEVAALLDCSEPTARQLVSRGLRRVRAVLAAFLEIDR